MADSLKKSKLMSLLIPDVKWDSKLSYVRMFYETILTPPTPFKLKKIWSTITF